MVHMYENVTDTVEPSTVHINCKRNWEKMELTGLQTA